ncbi:capsid protein [Crucivirus-113]|nr:capsid protein [Crucivirus-113]
MPKYTQAQKIAYYKKKAVVAGKGKYHLRKAVKRIRGKGSYFTDVLGAIAKPLTNVLGSGAYDFGEEVKAPVGMVKNSLFDKGMDSVPAMHSTGASVRICHREYIRDISSTVAFSNTKFELNPGLSESFPWLSQLAGAFTNYKWNGLAVQLKTMAGNSVASTTSTLGIYGMVAQYNTSLDNYANKSQCENAQGAVSAIISNSLMLGVECDNSASPFKNLYVRQGAVPDGNPPQMYDLCNVQIFSSGAQAAQTCAELWITYDIELLNPLMSSHQTQGLATLFDIPVDCTVASGNFFGSSPSTLVPSFDDIGVTLSKNTGAATGIITFPVGSDGSYLINYSTHGTAATVVAPPTVTYSNCTTVKLYKHVSPVTNLISSTESGASTSLDFVMNVCILVTDPSVVATVTFNGGVLPSTSNLSTLLITQLPADILA